MKLPEKVAKHFDCDCASVIITKAPHRQRIDLTKITLSDARRLHAEGLLPMLRKKESIPDVPVAKSIHSGAFGTGTANDM